MVPIQDQMYAFLCAQHKDQNLDNLKLETIEKQHARIQSWIQGQKRLQLLQEKQQQQKQESKYKLVNWNGLGLTASQASQPIQIPIRKRKKQEQEEEESILYSKHAKLMQPLLSEEDQDKENADGWFSDSSCPEQQHDDDDDESSIVELNCEPEQEAQDLQENPKAPEEEEEEEKEQNPVYPGDHEDENSADSDYVSPKKKKRRSKQRKDEVCTPPNHQIASSIARNIYSPRDLPKYPLSAQSASILKKLVSNNPREKESLNQEFLAELRWFYENKGKVYEETKKAWFDEKKVEGYCHDLVPSNDEHEFPLYVPDHYGIALICGALAKSDGKNFRIPYFCTFAAMNFVFETYLDKYLWHLIWKRHSFWKGKDKMKKQILEEYLRFWNLCLRFGSYKQVDWLISSSISWEEWLFMLKHENEEVLFKAIEVLLPEDLEYESVAEQLATAQ